MKKTVLRALAILSLLVLAPLAYAQSDIRDNPASKFLLGIIDFINEILVPFVFAVAFILFIWGVFQAFIVGANDEERRENGKKFIMWGIIALFVMSSVWGIVNLVKSSFGFGTESAPPIPAFNDLNTIRGGEGTDTFGGDTGNDTLQDTNGGQDDLNGLF